MSKFGVHVSSANRRGFGDYLKQCADVGSPVPVVFALDQDVSLDIAQFSSSTRGVFRTQKNGPDNGNMYAGDPMQAGRDWVDDEKNLSIWHSNAADYYALVNEPGRKDAIGLDWLCKFFIGGMSRANELGLHLSIGEWSTGNPPLEITALQSFIDMMAMARAGGHILGLHEYANSVPMTSDAACLRYRQLYALLPPSARPLLVISEAAPNIDTPAWNSAAVRDFGEYDLELMRDDYVIGACAFDIGKEINLLPVLPQITQWVIAHPAAAQPDPPPADPIRALQQGLANLTARVTVLEMKAAQQSGKAA